MLKYSAPVREMLFALEVAGAWRTYAALPRYAHVTEDVCESLLTEAGLLCARDLLPLNAIGDAHGCELAPDGVRTPPGFSAAFRSFADGGWLGLPAREEHGGQGLPETLNFLLHEMIMSTNFSFGDYIGLPQAAYRTLDAHGSPALHERYLRALVSGACSATMCMTEPQCGTDVGLIRTRATPLGEGEYSISGTKIFISAGDHDLSPNVLHLVLARLADAPPGVRGLSLFAVPKILPDGARNTVRATQLEKKMGYKAAATCEMAFEGARGWLVGEPHRGLKAMFVMVNTARLLVAVQGIGTAEIAYQNAAAYARERLQGRRLTGAARPELPADPLLVQPDVRRLLLKSRAFVEAARVLLVGAALQGDVAAASEDSEAAARAARRTALLTPVLKAMLTELGFEACNDCLQVFGGHGYIWSNGMEQLVRDCRIAPIQEGANGIQALDLIARKIVADDGRAFAEYVADVGALIDAAGPEAASREFASVLREALATLESATAHVRGLASTDMLAAGAASYAYLQLFGRVALGTAWLAIVRAAAASGAGDIEAQPFLRAKLHVARYYFARELPAIAGLERMVRAPADAIVGMPDELF